MHMSSESLLVVLLVGLVAGWLAGRFVDGTGFGLIGDVVTGIIGAFIGNWLMPRLGLYLGAGLVAMIANATIVLSRRQALEQRLGPQLEPSLALAVDSRSRSQPKGGACPRCKP